MTECWLPVVGWETDYSISSLGRLRRERAAKGIAAGTIHEGWMNRSRYKAVGLGHSTQRLIHQLVLEAFHGPRPEGGVGNHKDGDKTNNAAANLEWTTYSGNNRHAYATGLKIPHRPRLTPDHVRAIRESTETQAAIAKRFGVHPSQISRIRSGQRW